jgi:hypothetical protein
MPTVPAKAVRIGSVIQMLQSSRAYNRLIVNERIRRT